LGILVLASGVLTILFGQRETSDFWADGLVLWWESVRAQLGQVKRLVLYLDNGPKNAGTRTQWLKRMVEFCDWSGLEIRLVYYPPYHSKYNPIEHCWGVLEQKWGGTLLVSLKVILHEALRMTWRGQAPVVKRLHGEYPDGVRLTRAQMKPYEQRLKRSQTLPKYDITITPLQSARQVG
jgi:Rhodopirellula transposase DDE domain